MDLYEIQDGYKINTNVEHYIDLDCKDEWQKEVYMFAKEIMKSNSYNSVIDIGCGSGYKLIKYLNEYETLGVETEPCYSFLKEKYPDRKWDLSGEQEKSFNGEKYECDLVICSDVIEHIINPNDLINYLLNINAKMYILSTPCRDVLCNSPKFNYSRSIEGPPLNPAHVREWTFDEFRKYVSRYFTIIDSKYGTEQIECQFHLLSKK